MEATNELRDRIIESLLNYFFGEEPHSYPCCSVFSMGEWHYGAVTPELFERLTDLRDVFSELKEARGDGEG